MKKTIQIIILVLIVLVTLSMIFWDDVQEDLLCGPCPQYSAPPPNWCENGTIVPSEPNECGCFGFPTCYESFDHNSWKEIIDDDCRKFSDGCNKCTRSRFSDVVGCTKMHCEEYQMPKCLD